MISSVVLLLHDNYTITAGCYPTEYYVYIKISLLYVYVTGFWKTVPNHIFIISYIYHCHSNNIHIPKYFLEFIDEKASKNIQEIFWKYMCANRNIIKYVHADIAISHSIIISASISYM